MTTKPTVFGDGLSLGDAAECALYVISPIFSAFIVKCTCVFGAFIDTDKQETKNRL